MPLSLDILRKAYASLPQLIMIALRPFVSARPTVGSRLLVRLEVPYEQAVYDMGIAHWEQHVRELGLTGHRAVLDLGCGAGQWLPILAQYNGSVVGLDPEARLLDISMQHTGTPNIKL